jgi:hypothetical protein
MKIAILAPMRGRPLGMRKFLGTLLLSVEQLWNMTVTVGIDNDDEIGMETAKELASLYDVKIVVHDASKLGIGTATRWNELLRATKADIYGMGSNDCVYATKGWDNLLRQAFEKWPDRIGMVYGNDLLQGEKLATYPFVSQQWTDTLGYFTPEWVKHYYSDTYIHELAKRIGRCQYIPELIIEHLHYGVNKNVKDETYCRTMENCWDHDSKWFATDGQKMIETESQKLLEVINNGKA